MSVIYNYIGLYPSANIAKSRPDLLAVQPSVSRISPHSYLLDRCRSVSIFADWTTTTMQYTHAVHSVHISSRVYENSNGLTSPGIETWICCRWCCRYSVTRHSASLQRLTNPREINRSSQKPSWIHTIFWSSSLAQCNTFLKTKYRPGSGGRQAATFKLEFDTNQLLQSWIRWLQFTCTAHAEENGQMGEETGNK